MNGLVHYECVEVLPKKKIPGCKLEKSYVRRTDFLAGKFTGMLYWIMRFPPDLEMWVPCLSTIVGGGHTNTCVS